MIEKRKDNRGRVLHNGEIQRKDGRYQFKYIDANGKEKFVYSWRLDHNGATLQGKVRTLSLREMERQIQADLFDNIVSNGGNMTVLELVEKYISTVRLLGHYPRQRCGCRQTPVNRQCH